jgi:hypothetical protein
MFNQPLFDATEQVLCGAIKAVHVVNVNPILYVFILRIFQSLSAQAISHNAAVRLLMYMI